MIRNPKTFQAVTAIRQSKSNYNCKPSIDESDTILGIEIDNKLNFEKVIQNTLRLPGGFLLKFSVVTYNSNFATQLK